MDKFAEIKEWMELLDAMVKPIATRPIDLTDPNWRVKLQNPANPLEEAGINQETEDLLADLNAFYPVADDEMRQSIRQLFAGHKGLAWAIGWASTLANQPATENAFHGRLIFFSIKDQGPDARDAILELQSICESAISAGVNIGPILKGVAEISSDVNKYGMGSTRSLLLNAIPA